MEFTYLPGAPRALSLSLPLREEPYDHDACEPYFEGLLPESDHARRQIALRTGCNANNPFSMLQAIGHECAGAVSLHPITEATAPAERVPLHGRILPEDELAMHIRQLDKRPLFLDVDGIRLSLAGAQDKAAVCLIDGHVALPHDHAPSTHILKPLVPRFDDMVLNEYLCMRLAAWVGLPAPEVGIRTAEDIPYLLIKRYDRVLHEDGTLSRLHQEDFCQALGRPSRIKYQSQGGPGVSECFGLARQMTRPAVSVKRLLEHLLFNVLIGNCDAHAKNYSLLHHDHGVLELAPVYDVICTRYYPGINPRMAMKIGGYHQAEDLIPRRWEHFCEEVGISRKLLRTTLVLVHEQLQTAIEQERACHADPEAHRILDFIQAHGQQVSRRALAAEPA